MRHLFFSVGFCCARRVTDLRYLSVPERITFTTGFRCATDKLVLGALSTFADFKTGRGARMSLPALVSRAQLPLRTVERGLHRLEADGWIVAVTRRRRHATVWNITLDRLATNWVNARLVSSGIAATGGGHSSAIAATGGGQDPGIAATSGGQNPCTSDPQRTTGARARGAPEQLAFGPMDAAPDVWAAVKRQVESQLSRWLFHQWWADSVLVEDRGDTLVVRMKNGRTDHEQAAAWITRRDAALLHAALAAAGRPGARVEFAFAVRTEPVRRQA